MSFTSAIKSYADLALTNGAQTQGPSFAGGPNGIRVSAASANGSTFRVSGSDVAANQGIELGAGDNVDYRVANANLLYFWAAADGLKVQIQAI